jgi:peroxiredoxin
MELDALARASEGFNAHGASLALISPQLVTHNLEFGKEKKLAVPILSDPGNAVAALYGLRWTVPEKLKQLYQKFGIDLPRHNGDETWTLPMPARLIIDRDRIVRHAEISLDHTVRPDPEDTLFALKELQCAYPDKIACDV